MDKIRQEILDNHHDTYVDNYVMAEFVLVPPNFSTETHVRMREKFGVFDIKEINQSSVKLVVNSIKNSAVFATMNNFRLDPRVCFFVMQMFKDLGLIINKLDNPFRKDLSSTIYEQVIEHWNQNGSDGGYLRSQRINRISFIFINLYYLLNDEIYGESMEAYKRVQLLQNEIDETVYDLDNMP